MIAWEEWVVVKEVVVAIVEGTAGEEEVAEMTVVVVEEVEVVENSTIKIGEVVALEVTVTSHEVLGGMVVVEATMVVVEATMLVPAVVVVVEVVAVEVTTREEVRWLHVLVLAPLPLVVTMLLVALTCRVITPGEVLTVRAGVLNKDSSNKVNKLGDNNRLGPIKHSKAGELRDMDNGVMVNSSLQIQVSKHRLIMQHGELTILVRGHSGVRTINSSTSSGTDNKQQDSTERNNQRQLLPGHLQGPQLLLAQRRLLNKMMCTYTI